MSIPSYEQDPFWTPSTVEEAAELAQDLAAHGIGHNEASGVFGEYADLSGELTDMAADLPPVGGGWEPVDAATVERPAPTGGRQSAKFEPGTPVEWGNPAAYAMVLEVNEADQTAVLQPAALDGNGHLVATGGRKLTKALSGLRPSDKKAAADLSGAPSLEELERRYFELTGEDFRRTRERAREARGDAALWAKYEAMRDGRTGDPGAVALAADLGDEELYRPSQAERDALAADLSDDEFYQLAQEELDGTATRRRAERNAGEAAGEREDYWRRAYERGEPVPRDFQDVVEGG